LDVKLELALEEGLHQDIARLARGRRLADSLLGVQLAVGQRERAFDVVRPGRHQHETV